MGTSSGRRNSHPVFPVTGAIRLVQVTVIMVELLNWGFPFSFFPLLPFSSPCGLLSGETRLKHALKMFDSCGFGIFLV